MPTVVGLTPKGTKLVLVTASGPASDVAVGANASATVALSYGSSEASKILRPLAILSISGLPDGAVLSGFTADESGVTLTVRDVTGSGVTVSAGSVSAILLVEAI